MSPVPVIELQRRLTLVGAVRAGGEKPERGVGRKLSSFRLTSPRRELIEQAASLYGGEVSPWESPVGTEWQVYTSAEELPVLVMPGYSVRQSYELWEGATKRTRMCDGVDEELSGGPCICNAEGVDRCDLYTRLVVALPELDTVLGWRLITRGANAGHEMPTMMALIEQRASGSAFVPARIRIDERRGVKDGQVVRFVVPVIDLGTSYVSLTMPKPELPAAPRYAADRRPTVDEALASVKAPPAQPERRSNAPAALGPAHDDIIESAPLPVDDDAPGGYGERRQTLKATDAQIKKMNVLVGKLRDAGHITTESIYLAIATQLRNVEVDLLIAEVDGRDASGVLHWAPLRDALLRPEANVLIDWLSIKEKRVGASAARTEAPSPTVEPEPPPADPDFPPGY